MRDKDRNSVFGSGMRVFAIKTSLHCLLTLLLLPVYAHAQSERSEPDVISDYKTAPVVVDGRTLFHVRGATALPAEQRAEVTVDRIIKIAADRAIPVEDLRIIVSGQETDIVAKGILIVGLVDADAALEGIARETLAKLYRNQIAGAIQSYRYDRRSDIVLKNGFRAAGAVLIALVLIFLIVRLSRRLTAGVETRFRAKIRGLRIQSVDLVQSEKVWSAILGVVGVLRSLLMLVVTLSCLEYILSLFPWTRWLAVWGAELVLDPLRSMGTSLLGAIPSLLFIIILILIIRYIFKLAGLFFAGIESGTITLRNIDPAWAVPTFKIFKILVIAFAAVVAYPYIPGSGSEAFKGISIFMGVLFSLGSNSVVSNTIAGYAMIYRRAFKIGDRIKIGDNIGDVFEIRTQATHLRTLKNEVVVIPNSEIVNSHVVNYSKLAQSGGLILHTTVGIGYETPWRQVESMLLIAAERTSDLLRNPPPYVLQKALGDFCVTYEINAYCNNPQASQRLYSELHKNILDVFNEYGVQIMTPAYEGDPEEPKVVPKDKWYEAPAVSRNEGSGDNQE